MVLVTHGLSQELQLRGAAWPGAAPSLLHKLAPALVVPGFGPCPCAGFSSQREPPGPALQARSASGLSPLSAQVRDCGLQSSKEQQSAGCGEQHT